MSYNLLTHYTTADWETISGNQKIVVQYNVPDDFKPYSLTFRNLGNGSNTKALIYTSNLDLPDVLVAVSEEKQSPGGYTTFYFNGISTQSAGDYFFGFILSGTNSHYGLDNSGEICYANADTYADGPSDPFGTPVSHVQTPSLGFGYLYNDDISISKSVAYAVLGPPLNVAIAKTVAYVVLDIPRTKQANVMVIT